MCCSKPKLSDHKLVVIDSPFPGWDDADKMVLVPAIHPDVTIIHVREADRRGNCRMQGLTFADVEQAKAARQVIVTCERLLDDDELRRLRRAYQGDVPGRILPGHRPPEVLYQMAFTVDVSRA